MAAPAASRAIKVAMAQPDMAPLGGVKWKALFDNNNPTTNKILFCNTHTAELMPWFGFSRQRGKDYIYTCIPHTNEQHQTFIDTVEAQVSHILSQHEWSRNFKLLPTQKIYPKTEGCIFYEKREDGQLYRTNPDIEGELYNTPEKSLSVGAVLQVGGVFLDFATHIAKLTYKLVTATYAWTHTQAAHEEVLTNYLSIFGPIASENQQQQQHQQLVLAPATPPPQSNGMDIVEVAAAVSGITTVPETPPLDKDSFLASLSKLRTVGGIQRKMRQLQKRQMDANFREWCEQEARRMMFSLSAKNEEKKRRKAEEEEVVVAAKKVKPFTLQRSNNMTDFKVVLEDTDALGSIISTDEEEEEEEVE